MGILAIREHAARSLSQVQRVLAPSAFATACSSTRRDGVLGALRRDPPDVRGLRLRDPLHQPARASGALALVTARYQCVSGDAVCKHRHTSSGHTRHHRVVRALLLFPAVPIGGRVLDPQGMGIGMGMCMYMCMCMCMCMLAVFWVRKVKREEGGKKDDLAARRESGKSSGITFASVKYSGRANTSGLIFVMDRSVGNMLEQTPPFLLGVWLHAIAVSPEDAAWYGWFWLVMRAT